MNSRDEGRSKNEWVSKRESDALVLHKPVSHCLT